MDELERDYMDNHSVMNHPDFIEAANGDLMGPDGLPLNFPFG